MLCFLFSEIPVHCLNDLSAGCGVFEVAYGEAAEGAVAARNAAACLLARSAPQTFHSYGYAQFKPQPCEITSTNGTLAGP